MFFSCFRTIQPVCRNTADTGYIFEPQSTERLFRHPFAICESPSHRCVGDQWRPHSKCDFPPLTAIFFLLLTQLYGSFKKLQLIQKKSDEIFLASKLLRSSRQTVLTRKKPIFTVCRALESFFMFSTHTVLS